MKNYKVRCVKNKYDDCFKVGNIYIITDNNCIGDYYCGLTYLNEDFSTIDKLNAYFKGNIVFELYKEEKETMKAKLVLDSGKEIDVELNTEQLTEIQAKKKTGYERVEKGKRFYVCVDDDENGYIDTVDNYNECDEICYDRANYCNNETLTKNNARADKIMRQLRRFAVENSEEELDWNNINQLKYYCCYDYHNKELISPLAYHLRDFGNIYFGSEKTCQKAIEEFKEELIWYFTEYKDRV